MSPDTPAKPLEDFVRDILHEAEVTLRREPAKAVAMAFGIGLLFHVLPKRLIVSTATTTALTLLKPALLTFGIVKAAELVLSQSKPEAHSSHE
ncbi:hypothetical protein [Roseimicrobium sp. ORNL1]|uniref:hypothetical protein n=1 Tax=Roseimicrobium sp. ORNL1 TaxID=2711231 RepID=UPI0013E1A477|nr:hypothetical protein [Roseimicrobium sp. ORNL1]QIF02595.1 hypothetical protein G5S37_14030 [Roseimicrobium sp. ORNL1]